MKLRHAHTIAMIGDWLSNTRFGHVFQVSAAGLSADMLHMADRPDFYSMINDDSWKVVPTAVSGASLAPEHSVVSQAVRDRMKARLMTQVEPAVDAAIARFAARIDHEIDRAVVNVQVKFVEEEKS